MGDSCCKREISAEDPRFLELAEFMETSKGKKGTTMEFLQEAQRLFGYLPLEVHRFIAEKTGLNVASLYGVSTFYSQFTTEPKGKHSIHVCLGTACYVKGAQSVLDKLKEILQVEEGKTTEDSLFTLEATRCLGCCGLAPVIKIDDRVYAGVVDLEEIEKILDDYREPVAPQSSSLDSSKEVAYE